MNPYQQYALAQQNPGMYREIAAKAAQARTGELAKNMFAQLAETGLDPNSKEYFQAMRQRALESGDENLFGMGQQQNQAQQGYAFDNPYYTSDIKEYIMTSGDTELQDKAALANFIQQSNRSKATNVSINNQPWGSQPSEQYVPLDVHKEIVDAAGNAVSRPLKFGEIDGVNYRFRGQPPTEGQQTAASAYAGMNLGSDQYEKYDYSDEEAQFGTFDYGLTKAEEYGMQVPGIVGSIITDAARENTVNRVTAKDFALEFPLRSVSGGQIGIPEQVSWAKMFFPRQTATPAEKKVYRDRRVLFQDLKKMHAYGLMPEFKPEMTQGGDYKIGKVKNPVNGMSAEVFMLRDGNMKVIGPDGRSYITSPAEFAKDMKEDAEKMMQKGK